MSKSKKNHPNVTKYTAYCSTRARDVGYHTAGRCADISAWGAGAVVGTILNNSAAHVQIC